VKEQTTAQLKFYLGVKWPEMKVKMEWRRTRTSDRVKHNRIFHVCLPSNDTVTTELGCANPHRPRSMHLNEVMALRGTALRFGSVITGTALKGSGFGSVNPVDHSASAIINRFQPVHAHLPSAEMLRLITL
jgi:hypothetical protein